MKIWKNYISILSRSPRQPSLRARSPTLVSLWRRSWCWPGSSWSTPWRRSCMLSSSGSRTSVCIRPRNTVKLRSRSKYIVVNFRSENNKVYKGNFIILSAILFWKLFLFSVSAKYSPHIGWEWPLSNDDDDVDDDILADDDKAGTPNLPEAHHGHSHDNIKVPTEAGFQVILVSA